MLLWVLLPLAAQKKSTPCGCKSACTCRTALHQSPQNCTCIAPCKCHAHTQKKKKKCVCGPACACGATAHAAHAPHPATALPVHPFVQMMNDMMTYMHTLPQAPSMEADFVAQMVPHHLAAIQMAEYQIAHGKDFELIQLAKSIRAQQKFEIAEMELMAAGLSNTLEKPTAAYTLAMSQTMETMMAAMPAPHATATNTDAAFAQIMLPHHQAAIDMGIALLRFNPNRMFAILAQKIIAEQLAEVALMKAYLQKNQPHTP